MKTNYFYAVIFGMMVLTITSRSQNLLFDGDFTQTTEIITFDTLTPPLNTWAYSVNEYNGAEVNLLVDDGVAKIAMQNAGYDYPDVQFVQLGFPLIQGHVYQFSFDVRADSDRYLRIFLGEEGGNAINLIENIYFSVTTGWQTKSVEFIATSVFDLHKLSFELGGSDITTYLDNVVLQDLGPAPPEKVVIAGTFQNALGCETDWDAVCEVTALNFDPSTELYSGTFEIPEGNHRYKVAVGGSWDLNYGENGVYNGADIFLCIPAGPEEVTFTYDPSTHLVTTSSVDSGFSPNCLPIVVLAGSFQEELGCSSDWMSDCTNTTLTYNTESGLFEGDFNIPPGCYYYRIYLENSLFNSFGQEGIFNGENYDLYVPSNPEMTHFTYDPVTHVVNSSPYGNPPQKVTQVFLVGSMQEAMGCNYNGEFDCEKSSLIFNTETGTWGNSFVLPEGCYSYQVRVIFGCDTESWGEEIQLYVPENQEINFIYDPETHLIESTPFSEAPQEVTKVSLVGSFQDELGCEYEFNYYGCDKPALENNPETGMWEGSFWLPSGCYSYFIKETFGCNVTFYGENGTEGNNDDIELYLPEDGEITFSYDPETHQITSTPFSSPEISKVSLTGTIQEILCTPDFYCDKSALTFNTATGKWEGNFTLPKGCYTYQVEEISACNTQSYGENGEIGGYIQLYVPSEGEVSFSYDPQTHLISSTPYSGNPEEITSVSLEGSFQNELILNAVSGLWEGSFTISEGCYTYRIREAIGCNVNYYGENGDSWPEIQLYVPTAAEVNFKYDPQTHLISSTPYSGNPEEITSVSLEGSLQDELILNADSGFWESSLTLSEGCYTYRVREAFGCNVNYYGENGEYYGPPIELYVPAEAEITFSYDPQTHLISSTPYSGNPEEITSVSLEGSLQNELILNSVSGFWENSFTLSEGCYTYQVRETIGCNVNYYGENGEYYGPLIVLYVPTAAEITFSYDPQTHLINSTPYSGNPEEITSVTLEGSFQNELILNADSGFWENSFTLSEGCYTYQVREAIGCYVNYYGENGEYYAPPIELYVPTAAEITFSYDPQTHLISSTPYSGNPEEITSVTLEGSLQNELILGADSEFWENSFTLSEGCYTYRVREAIGCNVNYYGENGENYGPPIELYVPTEAEITFSYDPQTHLINSTPYSGNPAEITSVSLEGSLPNELILNAESGFWEGSFTLSEGCYTYRVKEVFGCEENYYGENGEYDGPPIELYVPTEAEITFSYNPQIHLISSTPYSGNPEEITSVMLEGSFQNELILNGESGFWEGNFTLSEGCYTYRVREAFGCDVNYYGENGEYDWPPIELYVPTEAEITFSYDPQTHLISSTPYTGNPEEITSVTLEGSLQNELIRNADSGFWENSFTLSEGCYIYRVREAIGCEENYYGENGEPGRDIELYVPAESEITFIYDPVTHIITTSPYSGVPEEVTSVSLYGYFSDSVSYPSLTKNETSGNWEGKFELPAGCYTYWVEENLSCWTSLYYGENGIEWSSGGKVIQLYIPESSEVNFSYDPQTHIMTSSPYSGAPQEITKVSILMYPNNLSVSLNPDSGEWEGSVELTAGCYYYDVRETFGCEETSYGGNQFYMPLDGEITFRYDPQTHNVISTPYSGIPDEVTNVNLIGSLDGEYGAISLSKNEISGKWEGTYMAPAGCYTYMIEEVFGCTNLRYFGQNGIEWGEEIPLFVPSETEITLSYDPETHLIISLPYTDISTVNQCPEDILVNNIPGTCGAVVEYPDFVATANCGGEIVSVTQTEGLASGSLFPIGTTTNTYVLTNTTGEIQTCSFDVVVTDREAPVIADLQENYEPLWPPNHKMVPVFINYIALDNCNVTTAELSVTSNEPQTGNGNGDKAPDWEIVDEHNVLLRAERDPKGYGREYYITIKVTDDAGNFIEQVVTIKVPINNGKATEGFYTVELSNDAFKLYPTPARDVVKIKGPDSVANHSYSIYDMLGVMKLNGIIYEDMIEVSTLPSGTYVLKFRSEKGIVSKQFIKK